MDPNENDRWKSNSTKNMKQFLLKKTIIPEDIGANSADDLRSKRIEQDASGSPQRDPNNEEIEKQQLTNESSELRKELGDVQRQLAETRKENKLKTEQLQEARDHIFHLQPRRRDITESEAQDAYKSLRDSVQTWVESRLSRILDDLDLGRLQTRPVPSLAIRFVTLIREPAKRCLKIDQSDEYHVMAVIMNYLSLVLFSKSFYCPLDDSDNERTLMWLNNLEETMSRLPRGIVPILSFLCTFMLMVALFVQTLHIVENGDAKLSLR